MHSSRASVDSVRSSWHRFRVAFASCVDCALLVAVRAERFARTGRRRRRRRFRRFRRFSFIPGCRHSRRRRTFTLRVSARCSRFHL